MPLDLAAKDNFAGVRKIVGLGIALRTACDALIAVIGANSEPSEALAAWRDRLAQWEQFSEDQQAVEVARGMRLMARYPTRQKAVVRSGPSIESLLPEIKTATPVPAPSATKTAPEKKSLTLTPTVTPTNPPAASTKTAPAPVPKTARRTSKVDESLDPLAQPTHTLPGIGPAFAEDWRRRGSRPSRISCGVCRAATTTYAMRSS